MCITSAPAEIQVGAKSAVQYAGSASDKHN